MIKQIKQISMIKWTNNKNKNTNKKATVNKNKVNKKINVHLCVYLINKNNNKYVQH